MIENIIKSQKDNKKYKKILIIIGIIIGIFAIINLVWFVGVKSRYIELTKIFNNSKNELGNYTKDIDGYRYIVKDTGYLNHSGFANVSIAKDIVIEFDDEGNEVASDFAKVTLYIWPKWFNGYTYGIDIDYGDYFYQINVDKDGNYIYANYYATLDQDGRYADLNAWSGKQWNALYTSKDKNLGEPITVELLVRKGSGADQSDYFAVHYFGASNAFDLNTHCYKDKVSGFLNDGNSTGGFSLDGLLNWIKSFVNGI